MGTKTKQIGEKHFREIMKKRVLPFLREKRKNGYFRSYDGTPIYYEYYKNPRDRASIVISHGFCEFTGKYDEVVYYLYRQGYSVFLFDYRGHGKSGRHLKNLSKVYISSYREYVGDLKEYTKQIVKRESISGKIVLFAHSMGGAVGALTIERYPDLYNCAVFASPMLEISFGELSNNMIRILALIATGLRWKKRYAYGQKPFSGVPDFEASGAVSKARYLYVFEKRLRNNRYQTSGATYGWSLATIKAIRKLQKDAQYIKIPILLFQAEKDNIVKPNGQIEFARKAHNVRLISIKASKHEIYNGNYIMRSEFYRNIFKFLKENC